MKLAASPRGMCVTYYENDSDCWDVIALLLRHVCQRPSSQQQARSAQGWIAGRGRHRAVPSLAGRRGKLAEGQLNITGCLAK
jgi:hypothetical protein